MHSEALYKREEILSQQLLPKPLTTLLLSKSSFWCFKLISFCSVCLGNGCRFLPGAPAAQTEEGQGSRVSPAPILRNPSRPRPASSPERGPSGPRGTVFSGLSTSNYGASSVQSGRSPASISMNHLCPWPIVQGREAAEEARALTSEVAGLFITFGVTG